MTDDESLDAMSRAVLKDMNLAQLRSGTLSLWDAYELGWQASAEYHTKRERERCAEIVFAELAHFKANGELEIEMPYLEVMLAEIEQEPKP